MRSIARRTMPIAMVPIVNLALNSQQRLADLLAERGYEFGAASDVSTALEPVSDGHVDLILADLSLPGGGGMELLEQVQQIGRAHV